MHLNLKPRKRLSSKKSSSRLGASISLVLFMIGLPILSVVGMEFLERGNFAETMQWITSNQPLFVLNVGLSFFLLAFIYALVGSLAISGSISTLILGLMAIISYMKVKMIGEPFFPWDILLNKESMDIASLVTGKAALIRISAVAAAILIVLALRWIIPRATIPVVARIGLGLFSLYALYAFGIKTPLAGKVLDHAGVNEIVWDQQQNYANNGLTLAFTLNVKNSIVQKPDTYSEQALAAAAANIQEAAVQKDAGVRKAKATLADGKQPNVIFVMSEAFWDPTLLENVTFSEDPLPTIHRLQKESSSGYLLSPQYGGGTSNVEFEVLTGNSMSFLPGGSIPYQQYISKPVPSLASYFADHGYKSMGIHSYEGWFWDRNSVYKQLGFEAFKSSEHFDNPEMKGYFISDAEVARNVISEVDKTENPMFIYTVTMQNHGPYDDPRYGENQFKATGNLSAQAKSILETYTQGAHDADQSLQMMIDHFKDSDEPTLIVFYGDHLPMLGMDYQVYKEAGFISTSDANKWSLEEIKKMHSIPLVTWSNFDMPKQDIPLLSDSFLGAHVLDMLHMEKPANFALDAELAKQVPGLLSNLIVDQDGQLHGSTPESAASLINDYRNVQYDLMFGKQYLADYLDHDYLTKGTQADYNAEFGTTEAAKSEAQGSNDTKQPSTQ
ncbi:LTA synthase family protein [Paenibacillus qinlingensis]|uniref:Phosphoglycerol transferase MdoB-like AlkP superfamily enzyme n=1 Tax=Paenibacillus qinlingensis TaxID=1837343 RepID=A0ABU1NXB9_9BACL|nr:LTA synthase family protein [Paenibacillus qinlingensis]MDR6552115.1 phosphoglycerol transferase MdoB-like AlkP superfamily enzyme [Paenibacillus qinlingensis]